MRMNISLQLTKCILGCKFSSISWYCFNCPALMCDNCKISMHETSDKVNHSILKFANDNIDWKDEQLIMNIFTDKALAKSVHEEVSRTFSDENNPDVAGWNCQKCTSLNPNTVKRCEACFLIPKESDHTGISDVPGWNCQKCTSLNPNTVKRCEVCYHIPNEKEHIYEYKSKLSHFQDNFYQRFNELEALPTVPVENVLCNYLRDSNSQNQNAHDWYLRVYLGMKSPLIVLDIIMRNRFNITRTELESKYQTRVQYENQRMISCLKNKNVPEVLQSDNLLQCGDVNNLNILSPNILSTSYFDEDLWKIIIQQGNYSPRVKRLLMSELDINDDCKMDLLRAFVDDASLGAFLKESFSDGRTKLIHVKQSLVDNVLIEEGVRFLQSKCQMCYSDFPMPEIYELVICNHKMCSSCTFTWLNETIRNKFPRKWNCPLCEEEDFPNIDTNLYYLNLREILKDDKPMLRLLETKLMHERIMCNPNFHWCPNDKCINGFEIEGVNKIQCPSCKTLMCLNCNRAWSKEHEGKTCQEFELWMLKQDANLLQMIGIECPKCGMRYSLAPGGCIHFKCVACGVDFCGGCNELLVDKCGYPICSMGNLHAHHPRNCFYHLRDRDVNELSVMLKDCDYPKLDGKPDKQCSITTFDEEFKTSLCNRNVYETTGVCMNHYKEYLVELINHFKIDPADFVDCDKLNLMLGQMVLPHFQIDKNEDESQFKDRLKNEVKSKCPLYLPGSIQERKLSVETTSSCLS